MARFASVQDSFAPVRIPILQAFVAESFDRVYSQEDPSGSVPVSEQKTVPSEDFTRINDAIRSHPLMSPWEVENLTAAGIDPESPHACAQYLNIKQVFQHMLMRSTLFNTLYAYSEKCLGSKQSGYSHRGSTLLRDIPTMRWLHNKYVRLRSI